MSVSLHILWPAGAYLAGAVPFGHLMARTVGVDIRQRGSGNIGATNVARVIGKRWGLLVLLADLLKGFLPVLLVKQVLGAGPHAASWIGLSAFAAVLGHCWSVFLGFKGGKGVATATGVFLALCPQAVVLSAFLFTVVVRLWGYVSVGSLSAAVLVPLVMPYFCRVPELQFTAWAVAVVIWWKHHENIRRLIKGEEKSFKKA